MLRLFSAPSLAAVLGLGGLAMAQDDLIVDPWRHAISSALASATTPSPGADRTTRPVGVAAFPIEEPGLSAPGPSVEPLGPPLNLATDPWTVAPVEPTVTDRVADPWAGTRLGAKDQRAERHSVAHRGHTDWAREIDEIVDPWSKGPLAVINDPLIVDPWAR
jgi:hypothetical protein